MDPILILIAASALITGAIGVFAVIRTNKLRAQLEDRILMLEMELSTVRRDLLDAAPSGPASELTDAAAIDGFIDEPRVVEALSTNLELASESHSIEQPSPSTALAVPNAITTTPLAEMISAGTALATVPASLVPRSWEGPGLAVRSAPLQQEVVMNSIAKVGVVLLVLGVASLPWRPSNRPNPTR